MKTLDTIAVILLFIGGLNWGLVGLANFNVIDAIFGPLSVLARIVYILVGISALYQIFQWRAMQKRFRAK